MISTSGIALIDTGCDHRVIDSAFAEASGFVSTGTTNPSGASGFVTDAKIYDLSFTVETRSHVRHLSGRFVAMPLAETGRKYHVILGMSFLSHGRLILDSQTDDYLFEFEPGIS